MSRGPERGFTLIELMVALVVSSLLVGMILAIFNRMSAAYRGQQQVAGVQQVLAAARAAIELDAKQAGLEMSQGFTTASTGATLQSPVQVINSSTGPDQIAFFYADPGTQAAVTAATAWPASVNVDARTGFAAGDLVAVTTVDLTSSSPTNAADANVAKSTACILQLAANGLPSSTAGTLTFVTSGVNVATFCPAGATVGTMIYKFVAHAYRIDPARPALGVLQQSASLASASSGWSDLAYGFTDIQTAIQVYDKLGTDLDGDLDANRNWYSSGAQNTWTSAAPAWPLGLLQMSISLVARTDRDMEGIVTLATPQLTVPANPANNRLGDRATVALPTTDPALQGQRIYRYTTFQVDFRNLGVGR